VARDPLKDGDCLWQGIHVRMGTVYDDKGPRKNGTVCDKGSKKGTVTSRDPLKKGTIIDDKGSI
jgi:hypothetical protein